MKISIIVPVYYNEESLLDLYADLKEKVLSAISYDYEIVMVDDGSKDNSYEVIQNLAKIDNKVIPVRLSRNFGEHSALLAGLSVCTGDFAIRKSADLQEPSEVILKLAEKYQEGYKVVLANRNSREDAVSEKFFAGVYVWLMQKFALPNYPDGGFDTFLIDRQVIDVLVEMKEKNTSLMSLILWSGFPTITVPYDRQKREKGKSRWTLSKKIKLVYDSLLGFSYAPIKMITGLGFICFFVSLAMLLYTLVRKLTGAIDVEGFTTLLIIMLMGFGIVMLSLGILGEYIGRIYDTARNRPPFIIDENRKEEE